MVIFVKMGEGWSHAGKPRPPKAIVGWPGKTTVRLLLFSRMRKLLFFIGCLVLLTIPVRGQELREVDGICYSGDKPFTGKSFTHYDNGKVKMESSFKKGKKDGLFKVWFESGLLNEIRHYRKNEMDGQWTTWNDKGIKVGEAGYRKGQKHGQWLVWSDDGKLIYEMYYTKGEKSGVWKNYNDRGEVINSRCW